MPIFPTDDLDARGVVGQAMALWCRFKGHRPEAEPVWSEGRHFATCGRCGTDIVRGRMRMWRVLSANERIVRTDEGLPRLLKG